MQSKYNYANALEARNGFVLSKIVNVPFEHIGIIQLKTITIRSICDRSQKYAYHVFVVCN